MTQLTENFLKEIEELQGQIQGTNILAIQNELLKEELNHNMDQFTENFLKEIDDLQGQIQDTNTVVTQIEWLKEEHKEEMDQLTENFHKQIEELQGQIQGTNILVTQIELLKEEHKHNMDQLTENFLKQIEELQGQIQDTNTVVTHIELLKEEHKQKMDQLTENFHKQIEELQGQIQDTNTLVTQIELLKEEHKHYMDQLTENFHKQIEELQGQIQDTNTLVTQNELLKEEHKHNMNQLTENFHKQIEELQGQIQDTNILVTQNELLKEEHKHNMNQLTENFHKQIDELQGQIQDTNILVTQNELLKEELKHNMDQLTENFHKQIEELQGQIQDTSTLVIQIELLKEEHKFNIYQLTENFLKQIEELQGQIQALNAEMKNQKITHEKTLAEMKEKHADQLKEQVCKHRESMYKEFEKYKEMEQRLQKTELKLREQEEYSHTTMKQACDDRVQDLEAEVGEVNNKIPDTIEDLKEKLFIKKQELYTEKKKVKTMETLAQKMKDELQTCAKYAQYPHLLKETFIKLQLHKPVEIGVAMDVQESTKHQEHLQMTVTIKVESHGMETKNLQAGCSHKLKLEAEVEEANSMEQKIIKNLHQQLKIQEQQLYRVQEKLKNMETFMQGIKSDIQNCSKYIQHPQQLRDIFMKFKLHKPARFIMQENTKQEHLQTMESEAVGSGKTKETIEDLELKLKIQKQVLLTERMKVKNMENQIKRVKASIQTCTRVLHYPHLLMETFMKLQIHKPLKTKVASKTPESIEDLEYNLKMLEKELCSEKKRLKNLNTMVKRMQDDIQTCAGFIHYPQLLKEHFMRLWLHKPERFNLKAGVVLDHPLKKEQLQKTVDSQEQRQATRTIDKQGENLNEAECNEKSKAIYHLKQKLKMKEKDLDIERQRVRNMHTVMERMKADILTCSSVIQEPKILKDNVIKLHQRYIHEIYVKAVGMQNDTLKNLQPVGDSPKDIQTKVHSPKRAETQQVSNVNKRSSLKQLPNKTAVKSWN